MKIDCPHCAGVGKAVISGVGLQQCRYCNGLGSVGLIVNTKKEIIICYICGERIYNKPYQFLVKGMEDMVMYAHQTLNEDGLNCKGKLDEAKRQRNFRLLPDGPLKEAFYESKKAKHKQPSSFIPS